MRRSFGWICLPGLAAVCLLAFGAMSARAEEGALGLTGAQILRMTDTEWSAYYKKHSHTGGARATYKAFVIYANCVEARNEQEMQRLPRAVRARYQRLETLLHGQSAWAGKPGNAAASHSLGERRTIADLLHALIRAYTHPARLSPAQSAKQTANVAQRLAHLRTAQSEPGSASQNENQTLDLIADWPASEQILVLDFLEKSR